MKKSFPATFMMIVLTATVVKVHAVSPFLPIPTIQTPAFVLDSTIDRNASGGKIRKTTYQYDEYGRITDQAIYGVYNNTWKGYSRQLTRFTTEGRTTYNETFQWNDAEFNWLPKTKDVILYTATGQQTLSESYNFINNQWVGSMKTENFFDNIGMTLGSNLSQWDAVNGTWKVVYKTTNVQSGNEVILNSYYWMDPLNDWYSMGKYKIVYTVNAQGEVTMSESYNWVDWKNSWQLSEKTEVVYNNRHQILKRENFQRDTINNVWVLNQRYLNNYDSEGRTILDELYALNTFTQKLSGMRKTVTAYDGFGNLTFNENFNWDDVGEKWITAYKTVREYNADNKITLEESYQWDTGLSAVFGVDKKTYTYNADKQLDIKLTYWWDNNASSAGQWVLGSKYVYTYDTGKYLTRTDISGWDQDNQTWTTNGRITGTWDANHLQVSEINESYNISSAKWTNTNKQLRNYDVNQNMTYLENFTWNISTWKSTGSTTYFYSAYTPNSVKQPEAEPEARIWSNGNHLYLSTESVNEMVNIYSIDGKLVTTQLLDGNTFEWALPKGLYLVKIKGMVQKIFVR